jgi:arylsulfatase A-like enzyme
VADHGARVYGSQKIPIHSYEIPLLIAGPAVVPTSTRVGALGCSLDVAPTILGLLGRPYESLFLGRDLLHGSPGTERVLINHNRDIGLFAQNRLVVFSLRKGIEWYAGDPKREDLQPYSNPTSSDQDLEKDGIALFQVADDLYIHEKYRIDGENLILQSRHVQTASR